MKSKTESKSVRYGMKLRPSTKTIAIYVLASFLLVIQLVKSVSAISISGDEFTTYDNRNFNNNPTGEFKRSNFYRFFDFTFHSSLA
jgi:hypothetical protein